jgi:hypothetical protein
MLDKKVVYHSSVLVPNPRSADSPNPPVFPHLHMLHDMTETGSSPDGGNAKPTHTPRKSGVLEAVLCEPMTTGARCFGGATYNKKEKKVAYLSWYLYNVPTVAFGRQASPSVPVCFPQAVAAY